jgi:hypothetical protein
MSDFDEARVKEEDIRGVIGNLLGSSFPFNGDDRTTRVTMTVDIHAEFCDDS